jgi:hypothetical protein
MSDLTGTPTHHRCPGLCTPLSLVPRALFACRPCWWRLPAVLRNNINNTFEARKRATGAAAHAARLAHAGAMGDAMRWYRDNKPEATP